MFFSCKNEFTSLEKLRSGREADNSSPSMSRPTADIKNEWSAPTTIPTWTGLGSYLGLRGERLTTVTFFEYVYLTRSIN